MENFEYSIALSDRDWAAFLAAAEECGLAPAALAEEEPRPGDIEQGDGATEAPREAAAGEDGAAGPGARGSAEGAVEPAAAGSSAPAMEQPPGSPEGAARRRRRKGASGAARAEPPAEPGGEGASREAVRPKMAARVRESRGQRGAARAAAPPASPRRGPGEEKAAPGEPEEKAAPGEPEAATRTARGAHEAASTALEPREVRDKMAERPEAPADAVPAAPAKAAPRVDTRRDEAGKLPDPGSGAGVTGDAAAGGPPANETPTSSLGSMGPNAPEVPRPEMRDYLFCDPGGDGEAAESPAERETIPLEREISLPELYEYFFNEPEGNGKRKWEKREQLSSLDGLQREDPGSAPAKESLVISVPEVYEHFFADGPGSGDGGRGLFLPAPASEVRRAVGALKSLLRRPMRLLRGRISARPAPAGIGSGETLSLIPLGRGRIGPHAPDMALVLPGRPEAPLALTHKDMCLVFCAFASWAVKTSDLQAPDAWKTVFLASFGTLSAIRYFRRQVTEGHPHT